MESHYEVLGVSADADIDDVRQAYRDLLKDHHPDHGGSRETFLRITEAYEEITGEQVSDGRRLNGTRPAAPTFDPAIEEPLDARLQVSGDLLTLSLVGLVEDLALADLVAESVFQADVRRTVAFFEVRNTSDRVLSWQGRQRTSFIGDDGFMYDGSSIVSPQRSDLVGPWWVGDVDIDPGQACRTVVVAGEMPSTVDTDRVVYTQHAYAADGETIDETERYLFEITGRARADLEQIPLE